MPTIGVDFKIRTFELSGKTVKLQIWDTAGQERFRVITKTYYKGAHGVLLTFDLTNLDTFNQIEAWIKQLNENAQKDICKILVGNKVDKTKNRVVSFEEANKLAETIKGYEIKIASKTGSGDKLFGSVNNIDLAAALAKAGTELDKKFIKVVGGSVKRLGKYEASVRLHRAVVVDITFEVVSE